MQDRPWSPSLSTNFPQRHSVVSKILAPVRKAIAIRSSSGLSRFPTLAIGKASDQVAVWLFCAVSSRQWFQGLGVSSRATSESLQARSHQADGVSFCRGDESWSADQASVALITLPWGNVREGSNLLTRPCQAKDDDRKHGRDRSAAERRPRPPCRIGRVACDQLSFPEVTLLIFSVFIFIAVSNASSSSLHLKHGALRSRYVSLGIERQFFKMKNAWCGSISSRFSVMLSSTLIFAFKCSGAHSWCRGDPSNCQWIGSGIERDGNWSWKSLLVWGLWVTE